MTPPLATTHSPGILSDYKPPQGFYDEFLATDGSVRQPWKDVHSTIDKLGPVGLGRRLDTLSRLIREYGVTYNVYSSSSPEQKLNWAMDVIPFILDGAEWSYLEDALSQRFHLIDLVLSDCYGAQRLLEGGKIPSDLVVGNPGFLPACHGLLPNNYHNLQFYSADLARSPDGKWWVLSDRLDAASGMGYAIENRQLSQRVLPDLMRTTPVRSLQPFVAQFSETIERLSPRKNENPHVVLLTPGPANETYFEHSFLARTLGYPLVEGADLTVRNSRVFLKTISGMQQVDVIVRRLDSEWCDPLELRNDSILGIPGLLQAVRAGNVAIANGLGCGLLQSPAFSAFFPGLCRNLLGEDLKIPSVATWWCGQEKALNYVLKNLPSLVIKPAKDRSISPAIFGNTLTDSELEAWRDKLRAFPREWCAQEMVSHATTPSFIGDELTPSPFLMRVYLIRHRGGYRLMPGGLARAATRYSSLSVSMQNGGISKDVWVTGFESNPVSQDNKLSGESLIRRSAHNLPSRVADNLFWLGRYFERAEEQTRLIRTLIAALMDESRGDRGESILTLFSALAPDEELTKLRIPESSHGLVIDSREAEKILRRWFREKNTDGGLRESIGSIMRTAASVKERLSLDAWHAVSNLADLSNSLPVVGSHTLDDQTLQAMDDIIGLLAGISGLSMENMTRGHGWNFQDLGRRIERSMQLCNLLYSTLIDAQKDPESLLWLLLQCTDSLITYRRRYFINLHAKPVIDLLIFDPLNPRSLAFQAQQISQQIASLPHHYQDNLTQPMDKAALRISSLIGLADLDALDSRDASGRRSQFADFLDKLAGELCNLSEKVGSHYFAITPTS
jgi:uncharacterized circularly permuted ATP-grasp superfamily protein/uncharacterized alpha-E superfamily protein